MNKIFTDMLDVCIIMYLDDILIYSDNMSQHKKHIKEVLWRLCKHGLYASPPKCEWHKTKVKYLNYISSLLMASAWTKAKSRQSSIGQNPTKSKTFNHS
jgi:hypothetical protein